MNDRPPAIRCVGLVKRYGDVTAVGGLDLTVQAGECFGLLGPNGAGKTTTIEILEGLTPADAGEVVVLGERWLGGAADRLLRERRVDEVLAFVELGEKRGAWYSKLSGGQKQRLAVACALVSKPELLFLDEPTTGLDPQSRRQLWDVIARFQAAGNTVLLTTHYMEEAERLCDRVAIMDHGVMIALGSPRDLIGSLGAEHVVEYTIAGDGAPEALDGELRALPGVRAVRTREGVASLTVAELHRTLPALMGLFERRGVTLASLTSHHATLEDVFVSLTGRHIRDD